MATSTLTEITANTYYMPEAANDNPTGFVTVLDAQPIEGGFDAVFGDVTWQTLISGDKTTSNGLVLGIATFPANGVLHLHRHAPPEFYFCLEGSGVVTMDGQTYPVAPDSVIFIPAYAKHGVRADVGGNKFAYGFGEDSFSAIDYQFSANSK